MAEVSLLMCRSFCLTMALSLICLSSACAVGKLGLQRDMRVGAPTRLDWIYTLANQSLAAPPAGWLADYDSTRQTYDLYVPKGLKGRQAVGLVLFISAGDKAAGWETFQPLCDERKLLFASPHRAGNGTNMRERVRLVLDVLDDVRRRQEIDPDRTYLAGFSGGGRVACQIAFALPECFGGVIPICAAGDLREETWLRHRVIERLSVAHVTGENDFNRGEVERFRGAILADVGVRSRVWVVPKMGHAVPKAEQLAEVMTWLEEGAATRKQLAQTWPASRIPESEAPTREEQASALLAEGQARLKEKRTLYSGLMQLKGVMVRWPDLPAAAQAQRELLAREQQADKSWEREDIAEQRKHLIARARGLSNYATGPIDKQYLSQRPQMVQAARELWKLILDDGQDAATIAEAKGSLLKLEQLRQAAE
jgi:predicted esterase